MSRTPVAIAGAVGALLLLAGCSAPTAQDDAQTLKYLFVQPESPETLELVKADIAHFEELNPGVKVDMDVVPFETLQSVLVPQLRSDSGPDVFIYDPGPGFAGALADAGLLYDLTDAYAENDWQTYQFAIDQVTFDGQIVGVPNEIEELGVFYNKDLFDEHGLEVPTTVAELESTSKKLLDDDIVPFAFGALDQWNGSHSFSMSLSSELGGDAVAGIVAGTTPIDTPETVATVQRVFQDFLPYYPEFPTALSYDDALSMFYAGEAAMLPTGTWMVQDLSSNADFEVGFFPYPATERDAIFSAGLGSGTFVSANTTKPELAVTFLDYLQSEERGLWQIENLQTIPASPVDASGADISPLFEGILADAAAVASGDGEFGLNIDVRMPASFNDVLYPGIQAVLTGTQSPADFVKDLQAAIDAEAEVTSAISLGPAVTRRAQARLGVLLVLPTLALTVVFFLIPLANAFFFSFVDYNGISENPTFVGFGNFVEMFNDPEVWHALGNNLVWIVFGTIGPVVIGFVIALLLSGVKRGSVVYRLVFFFPYVLPGVAIAVVWGWIYSPRSGWLNQTLDATGLGALRRGWLGEPDIALYAVLVTAIWAVTGFCVVVFLSALGNVDTELLDAARIDGAGAFQRSRYVVLPQIMPVFLMVVTLTLISGFGVFDIIYVMTAGGPANSTNVLGIYAYQNAFTLNRIGYATTIALLITALSIPFAVALNRLQRRLSLEGASA